MKFKLPILFVILIAFTYLVIAATPEGPSSITQIKNETSSPRSAFLLNTSGGYITTITINATTQNPRWKAYVGNVSGKLSLNDAAGDTIYDWSSTIPSGRVYSTRNSSTIIWSRIRCANISIMETENRYMNHTSPDDNITKTFSDTTHSSFFVGTVPISTNSCPTTNTYVNNVTQDSSFQEMVLFDGLNSTLGGNLVYTTIIENNAVGFDARTYDFQMLLPEVGYSGFASSTAYYFYVELV